VILACGIQDKLPAIPGFDSIWGRSVVHCVFCHGTETRGKAISILLDPTVGALGGHTILMFVQKFTNIHNDPVTIIANGVFGEGATEAKVVPELGITEDILKLVKHKG
jgi:thioredoxin reductase